MQYKYCDNENFEDLSCGRVIIHKSGCPNFPVRLAQEIFCRCMSYHSHKESITLYDPCCGGGYLLTVLGLLNASILSHVIGSDIDEDVLSLAENNLSLLSEKGILQRIEHLNMLLQMYNKQGHLEAIKSAEHLIDFVKNKNINTQTFFADVFDENIFKGKSFKADIIITDVPYGNLVSWQGGNDLNIDMLLDHLIPILKPDSIIAVCSDKQQKTNNLNYKSLEKQLIGKRKFQIFCLQGEKVE